MGSKTRAMQKRAPKPVPERRADPDAASNWLPLLMMFERVAKRLGPAAFVFTTIFAVVWKFADEPTQHDIIREIFFQKLTGTPYVGLFFAWLVFMMMFDGFLLRRYLSRDSEQVKRLKAEVGRLQAKLLEENRAEPATTPEVGQ
jgi:hypothetical protein